MRAILTLSLALAWFSTAHAAEDPVCPDDDVREQVTGPRWLRAVSLDLRGTVPTPEEYALLGDDGVVPDDLIDAWLDTPEFSERTVRHHRSLLWNNLAGTSFFNTAARIYRTGNRYYRRTLAQRTRGIQSTTCGDWENALDEFGHPVEVRAEEGWRDDGWVWVEPFWAPGTQLRVCTFDAQTARVSPRGTSCDTADAFSDPGCGCGPNLEWCVGGRTEALVAEALSVDVDLRVKRVIEEDLPYTELLTGSRAYVNGPLAHFLRNGSGTGTRLRMERMPYDTIPDLTYDQVDTWEAVDLGPEQSGVFTSPAFLIRFQTNRARANRFSSAFMCQDFQAPDGGLPPSEGLPTLDLTSRDGCKYCHALLEPEASHWGRWTETGASYLNPVEFPAYDADCARCASEGIGCTAECRIYYQVSPLTAEQDPYVGWLKSFEFLEDRHAHHVDEGPSLLIRQGIADRRLPTCVAQKAVEAMLERPVTEDDKAWVDDLATRFESGGWSYKDLVHDIVTSPNYRRLP
ncbi:MAG: hypothetical protein AB8H79_04110 [Myxococcota bacterium]